MDVFKDYGIFLKQAKEPIPPRDYVMEFNVKTKTKELEKILKLHSCTSDLQYKAKEVVTEYWDMFLSLDSVSLSGDFNSILTQVAIHVSSVNHLVTILMSTR